MVSYRRNRSRLGLLGVAVLALLSCIGGRAAAQAVTSTDPDPYAQPPCNESTITGSVVTTKTLPALNGGTEDFRYLMVTDVQMGQTSTYPLPMNGWIPAQASDAELQIMEQVVPARPTETQYDSKQEYTAALSAWNDEWDHPTTFLTQICNDNNAHLSAGTIYASYYSGFLGTKTISPFVRVKSHLFVDDPTYCTPLTTLSTHAAWVGIQGPGGLLQVGTLDASDEVGNKAANAQGENFFFEAVSNSPKWDTGIVRLGFLPAVKDHIAIYVEWQDGDQAVYYIHDLTSNILWSHGYSEFTIDQVQHPATQAYDGTNANVIDERITTGSGVSKLANYVVNDWFMATNTTANGVEQGIWNDSVNDEYRMTDDGTSAGTILSQIYAISPSDAFTDSWYHC